MMHGTSILSTCKWILMLCAFSGTCFAKGETLHRFAFVVGANDGGSGRSKLRFANQDAESFVTVLNELGGVASMDTILVRDASRASVNQGLATLKARILKSVEIGERQEVVFYYSGHSDEDGLRLKTEVLSYKDLKHMIMALPVQVQILVIDSCASGQLAMTKGGQRKPAFLLDVSSKARGHAIITSSSADEAAQESATVGGSIFTHYFLSGLRGAADTNGDQKVTLGEAYQYAYAETLARTEKTMSGAQHPSYDFKLAGTGDIVLTDLRQSSSVLTIPERNNGRYFIRQKNGDLIAEINKPAGRKIELGLAPGIYDVTYDRGPKRFQSSFVLASNQHLDMNNANFAAVDPEVNQTRGSKQYRVVPATIGLLPPTEDWNTVESDELHNFSLDLLGGHSGKLKGVVLGGFAHVVDEDSSGVMMGMGVHWNRGNFAGVQMTIAANIVKGDYDGAQMSVGSNWVEGGVNGAQYAAGLNYAGKTMKGAQIGIVNAGQDIEGAQIGIVNLNKQAIEGAQIGVVNVTEKITGAQVGVVNIAKTFKGAQLGVVNVSEDAEGVPIGVVSYVKNGRKDLDLYVDELGFTHIAFKMGSKYVYTSYDCGFRTGGTVKQVCGLGLGAIYERNGYFAAAESLGLQDIPNKYQQSVKTRRDDNQDDVNPKNKRKNAYAMRTQLTVGIEILEHSWIYAGPTIVVSNRGSGSDNEFDKDVKPVFAVGKHVEDDWSTWVGAVAGVKYSF